MFVAPGVTLTNDDTMARHGAGLGAARPDAAARVPHGRRRRAAAGRRDRRGGVRGRRRGRDRDVPARTLVMGVPARAGRARSPRRGPARSAGAVRRSAAAARRRPAGPWRSGAGRAPRGRGESRSCEIGRVWRRGSAPLPQRGGRVLSRRGGGRGRDRAGGPCRLPGGVGARERDVQPAQLVRRSRSSRARRSPTSCAAAGTFGPVPQPARRAPPHPPLRARASCSRSRRAPRRS